MAVWFILASAFLHAFWNARLKGHPNMEVAGSVIFLAAGLTALLSAAAAIVWSGRAPFPDWRGAAWTVAAGLFEAGYFTTLVQAFGRATMGSVYAVSRGFAIAAAWPISVLWLGEQVSAAGAAGALAVVAGLLLSSLRLEAALGGLPFAFACGGFIAGYHLFYKLAVEAGGTPTAIFALSLLVAVPVNVFLLKNALRRRLLDVWREDLLPLTGLGVLSAASFLLVLLALETEGAGHVITLRNTSVLFALLLAWSMGEQLNARQWAGGGLIALGAVLLGL